MKTMSSSSHWTATAIDRMLGDTTAAIHACGEVLAGHLIAYQTGRAAGDVTARAAADIAMMSAGEMFEGIEELKRRAAEEQQPPGSEDRGRWPHEIAAEELAAQLDAEMAAAEDIEEEGEGGTDSGPPTQPPT